MGERKLPSGMIQRGRVYWAEFRLNGNRIRKKLSTDKSVAIRMLADLRSDAYSVSRGEKATSIALWEDALPSYLRAMKQAQRVTTFRRTNACILSLKRLLPVTRVEQIDTAAIREYRARRLQEKVPHTDRPVTARTVNMEVGTLRAMLNWLVDEGRIDSNPLAKRKGNRRANADLEHNPVAIRALTSAEAQSVLDAASNQTWRDIWYFLLNTGLRKSELCNLVFEDIDFAAKQLTVHMSGAKSRKTRHVPFSADVLAILERQRKDAPYRVTRLRGGKHTADAIHSRFSKSHVFVSGSNTRLGHNVTREFKATCQRAGIPLVTSSALGAVKRVTLHSTRHTYATELIRAGVNPKVVQTLCGHATLDITMRIYTEVFGDDTARAISQLGSIGSSSQTTTSGKKSKQPSTV